MKKIITLFLSFVLLLSSCTTTRSPTEQSIIFTKSEITEINNNEANVDYIETHFTSLNDEDLFAYVEDIVYQETIESLNSDEYLVESVTAKYISKEYLDESAYNLQSNIYFGYTLDELNDLFQGTRYVFTLGEDGKTILQELQEIEDVATESILKNVAIGSGVILVCVTVSTVSVAVGAPAVSAIFAASAKTATNFALSSAAFGGLSAGIVRGIQTGNFNEALEATVETGSESFMWGAISGAVLGGVGEAYSLNAATANGLSLNDAARIQVESKLPIDVISQMHSYDEYIVYKQAMLKPMMVNGKTALIQNIDLNYVSELPDGTKVTNLTRMQKGYAPIEPATGLPYELHHIGQKNDGTLAALTNSQHRDNAGILNIAGKKSEIDRYGFTKIKKEFWEYLGTYVFTQ